MQKKEVIIACDFKNMQELHEFLALFPKEEKLFLKIGMELYNAVGPDVVHKIKALGHKAFLDLKLCDIPNTVKKAMMVLRDLHVDLTNVHAFGGIEMMKAAIEGLTYEDGSRPTKLIAVTMLTSIDENTKKTELLIDKPMEEVVLYYAHNAKKAGLDGVVCSAHEAKGVHLVCDNDFLAVTPGIRLANGDAGDQKRIMTPAKAAEMGSNYIVVGRPITQAADPVSAYKEFIEQFCN